MICPNENTCQCTGVCAAIEAERANAWLDEMNAEPKRKDRIWLEDGNDEYPSFYYDDSVDCTEYIRADLVREALDDALAWFSDPDADTVEQWERIALEFYRETGYLRPGKSYPMGSYVPDDLDQIWGEWTLRRQRQVLAKLRSARGEA